MLMLHQSSVHYSHRNRQAFKTGGQPLVAVFWRHFGIKGSSQENTQGYYSIQWNAHSTNQLMKFTSIVWLKYIQKFISWNH